MSKREETPAQRHIRLMEDTEQNFGFGRSAQLNTLTRARIKKPDESRASPRLMRAFLRAIDNFIGKNKSWVLKYDTIADWAGYTRDSVINAAKACEESGLICITSRSSTGHRANEYSINWYEMRRLLPPSDQFHISGIEEESQPGNSEHQGSKDSTSFITAPPYCPITTHKSAGFSGC